jgi:hypothetical protein
MEWNGMEWNGMKKYGERKKEKTLLVLLQRNE